MNDLFDKRRWEDEIPQHEWDRKWIWKIDPPRAYWDSEEQKADFMKWAEAKRREHGRTA